MGQAVAHSHPRSKYIPGHCTKHFKCTVITHHTFKCTQRTISFRLQGSRTAAALFLNTGTPLQVFLQFCFSHKSQFSSPSRASLRALPTSVHTPPPHPPTGRSQGPGRKSPLQQVGLSTVAGEEGGTAILLTLSMRETQTPATQHSTAAPPRGSTRQDGAGTVEAPQRPRVERLRSEQHRAGSARRTSTGGEVTLY